MPKLDYESWVGPDQATYGPYGSQVTYNTGILGGIVTIANGLFAAVMITIMIRGEWGAAIAIIVSGLYYGVTTLAALLILSGALTQMVTSHQEQQTRRLQITVLPYTQLPAAEGLQLPSAPAAEQLPGPLGGVTYVAAEDLTTRRNAALWAVTLYGSDGLPNPKMVHLDAKRERPGRLRIAAPAKREREWLENKKVLESIPHGVRLRVERYPDAAMLRSILND